MAFIRWKHNKGGNRQAYLIHSYRGEDGKPRHKMLAYLGEEGTLTQERVAQLREKHPDLKVDWEKIKPTAKPVTDISTLSDAELLRNARRLRHERGLGQGSMIWRLKDNGLPECTGSSWVGLGGRQWGVIEKILENGEPQNYYLNPETEIAPALRKVLSAAL